MRDFRRPESVKVRAFGDGVACQHGETLDSGAARESLSKLVMHVGQRDR
jgi:hypothetical protein